MGYVMNTCGEMNDQSNGGTSITLNRMCIAFPAFDAVVRIDVAGIGDVDRTGLEVVAGMFAVKRPRMPEEQGNTIEETEQRAKRAKGAAERPFYKHRSSKNYCEYPDFEPEPPADHIENPA